jgi:hypothetical protein
MIISRRAALQSLATGLPLLFFTNPRRALADAATCAAPGKAQFFVFSTSGSGDPLNCNAPGTYDDPKIVHPTDPSMAPTPITLGGRQFTAAAPWAQLPAAALARTTFFHMMTNTPVHPKEPDVLQLNGATQAGEMLPSVLARQLAPCLGTVQAQPISVGAATPSETITYGGSPLATIPPSALKATLVNPAGALTNLQKLRDDTLNRMYALYKNEATPAQQAYVDSLVTSQAQARGIRQDLLAALSSIADNSITSQMVAAVTLIQMKLSPVIVVHVPFGGDNHNDPTLKNETAQTVSGVAAIGLLATQLAAAGLADQVSFVSLNVFGRTLGPANTDGRSHNPNHHVSLAIGRPFKPGVIGGVAPVGGDYGATAVDSGTGAGGAGGDIAPADTLASFGRTVLAAAGVDAGAIDAQIVGGKVIGAALA